jgi:hypothetical protein
MPFIIEIIEASGISHVGKCYGFFPSLTVNKPTRKKFSNKYAIGEASFIIFNYVVIIKYLQNICNKKSVKKD